MSEEYQTHIAAAMEALEEARRHIQRAHLLAPDGPEDMGRTLTQCYLLLGTVALRLNGGKPVTKR